MSNKMDVTMSSNPNQVRAQMADRLELQLPYQEQQALMPRTRPDPELNQPDLGTMMT